MAAWKGAGSGGLGVVAPEGEAVTSYVNLIPTAQGGTHVNGLRAGLTEPCESSVNSATTWPTPRARGRLGGL